MKKLGYFLVACIFVFSACKTSAPIKENQNSIEPTGKEALLRRVREIYSPWEKLSASFVLKGKVENAEILYDGTLRADKKVLAIVLKDPIFRSPFVSLTVQGEMVTQVDHLRNKTVSMPLKQFKWVQVFGRVFPFAFFYPILKGFPPDVIYEENAKYSIPKPQVERLTSVKSSWESIVNFENSIMSSVFFKTSMDNEIVAISFYARQSTQRYFPKEILITRPKSNDHIRIQFKNVVIRK